jgi:2-phospho-L-lactate guanylyltransferase
MRSWTVVVPVKHLGAAKSRLAREDRADVALAMACDTVAAAVACPGVSRVIVVTDDPRAASALGAAAEIVADVPDRGLNAALVHGAEVAARSDPSTGVATLAADLPALRPEQLARALEAADGLDRALLADAQGDGTVLLLTGPGVRLEPHFGPASRSAHAAAGASDLTDALGGTVRGLRRDVDTLADLEDAITLGIGPNTALLAGVEPGKGRPPTRQATIRTWDDERGEGRAVTDDGTELVLPTGSRLVGLLRLRAGQRVALSGGGEEPPVICLVTEQGFPHLPSRGT